MSDNIYEGKRFVIYLRISTFSQLEGDGLDGQRHDIEKYIKGLLEIDNFKLQDKDIYQDVKSGATEDRPRYKQLKKDIADKDKNIAFVVCWKLDRISRNVKHLLDFVDYLKVYKVGLLSVKEKLDTTSDSGRFFLTMLAALGEMEKGNIKIRTMMGKKEKASKGYFVGGFAPYGYKSIEDGRGKKLEIVESQAKIINTIFNLYVNEGYSVNKIVEYMDGEKFPTKLYLEKLNQLENYDYLSESKKTSALRFPLNKWHGSVIKKILKNETYTGKYYYGRNKVEYTNENKETGEKAIKTLIKKDVGEWIEMECPKILEDDNIFKRAQILLGENKKITTKNPHHFSRLLHCGLCGKKFAGYRRKKGKYKDLIITSYRCGGKNKYKTPKDKMCYHSKEISEMQLIDIIWRELDDIFKNPSSFLDKYLESKNDTKNKIAQYEKELEEKRQDLLNDQQQYEKFILSSKDIKEKEKDKAIYLKGAKLIEDRMPSIEKEIEELQEQVERLKNREKQENNLLSISKNYISAYKNIDEGTKVEIIKKLVSKIVVLPHKIIVNLIIFDDPNNIKQTIPIDGYDDEDEHYDENTYFIEDIKDDDDEEDDDDFGSGGVSYDEIEANIEKNSNEENTSLEKNTLLGHNLVEMASTALASLEYQTMLLLS